MRVEAAGAKGPIVLLSLAVLPGCGKTPSGFEGSVFDVFDADGRLTGRISLAVFRDGFGGHLKAPEIRLDEKADEVWIEVLSKVVREAKK